MNTVSSEKRKYELKARAESQRETRERIVRATMELHREVGPAQTTVAEIARRANVQRLTVYNHFPQDAELFGACQMHWLSRHPLPDLAPALALRDPAERLTAVLHRHYGWYRETESMAEKVQRDRGAVPPLDDLLRRTADAGLAQLTEALNAGFATDQEDADGVAPRRRALIRLALDFWTWRRLDREGLDDAEAAELMAAAVAAVAGGKSG
jgi:AcrR family transcriptional regulator